MTSRLREVLKKAENWPDEVQEELADAVLEIAAGLEGEYHPTSDELVGLDRGLDDAREGRFARDEEVNDALNKSHRG
jgi:predicted transcriptional regulator